MILVTGATGRAGAEVVRALVRDGQAVRAFVRDPAGADLAGAELFAGDLDDAASVARALEGVDAVVVSGPDDPRRVARETALIDAAAAAGVRRLLKLSAIGAAVGSPVAFWDWHGRVEAHLRDAGVPWTVLRPSFFMTNLQPADGRIVAPAASARVAMVDPADVGAAAAAVLASDGHDGRTYVLTGPQAVTHAEAASALGAAYIDVPDEAALAAGAPAPVVAVYQALREGAAAAVTTDVPELTGRPARNFAAYAGEANKALVRRVFEEVIPSGDAEAMREVMDPAFLDHDPLPGQPSGGEGGSYVVRTMHGGHPDLRFDIEDLLAEQDRVAIRWTMRATNTGPFLGQEPTGRPVMFSALVVFRVAAGRLAERWAGWKPGYAPAPPR